MSLLKSEVKVDGRKGKKLKVYFSDIKIHFIFSLSKAILVEGMEIER